MSATAVIKGIVLQLGKVCCKINLPGKNNFNLAQLKLQCLFQNCRKVVQRLYNHTISFTHQDYANDTELLKKYWEIRRNKFITKVTWSIVRECEPYNFCKRMSLMCLNEKLEINPYKGNNLLNKRSELINKCSHLNRHTLLHHESKDQEHSFSLSLNALLRQKSPLNV